MGVHPQNVNYIQSLFVYIEHKCSYDATTMWIRENTILVSFGIKFTRRDQIQCRNDEACRVRPTLFLLDIKGHLSGILLIMYLHNILRRKETQTNKNKCSSFELAEVGNAL